MQIKIALASLSLAAFCSAAPVADSFAGNATAAAAARAQLADTYVMYRGDGSQNAGWPLMGNWYSYDALWNANAPLMRQSCGWNGWGANNNEAETNGINTAIRQVSSETGVDARYILAIVMQESKGCVRAPTTNNGVVNPGLMQSHNGVGSCWNRNPCPQSTILQMIRDGTAGTPSGNGLRQELNKATAVVGLANGRAHYSAARLYNSGSINYNDLNQGLGSTACYSVDVANRLTGWTLSASQCYL